MLSLAKAAKDYYLRKLGEISPREDYYLRGGMATGRWVGSGAAELGLEGTVSVEGLIRLFDGRHPGTGEQLGRKLRRDGVAAWDLTFSADKSVSLLWALGDEETRREVLSGFEEATRQALSYLEFVASATRGAKRVPVTDDHGRPVLNEDGTPKVRTETWSIPTTGYVAAAFTEFTSRADDPQLHTHVVVANRVKGREDDRWRALDGRLLYRHKLAAGYLHEAVLRRELTLRLGVRWQAVERGMADIEGFTRDQIEAFSRRRQALEAWRKEQGLPPTAAAREVATLATRTAKRDHPIETLVPEWRERALQVGLTPQRIASMLHRSLEVTRPDPGRVFEHLVADDGLTRDVSTFGRAEVIQAVAASFPEGATREDVERIADEFLSHWLVVPLLPHGRSPSEIWGDLEVVAEHPEPILRRGDGGIFPAPERRYSTGGLLATEQRIVERALAGIGAGRWRADPRQLADVLRRHPHLTEEQEAMVWAFCRSGNGTEVGVGPAGSGKTAVMAVLREVAARSGTPVYGAALAARAASGLEAATGIPSVSLAWFLAEGEREGLPRGSVVVVDEAGMVGTRTLARVSDVVEQAEGKLILVGDHRQLAELEAGGLFRALAQRLPAVELTENLRQREPWERQALAELREGSVARALEAYRERDRLRVSACREETLDRAVGDWYREVAATGDLRGTLLLAHRNDTVEELNRAARELVGGQLRGRPLWAGEREYRVGDRVLCARNSSSVGVLNGDLGTVVAVDRRRRTLTVRTDRDQVDRTLPAPYIASHLSYGYALTAHKAQGVTVERAFTVTEGATDREWAYVAMSRGRESNTLYVVDPERGEACTHLAHRRPDGLERLRRSLERSGAQTAAVDVGRPEDLGDWELGSRLRELEEVLGDPPPVVSPTEIEEVDLALVVVRRRLEALEAIPRRKLLSRRVRAEREEAIRDLEQRKATLEAQRGRLREAERVRDEWLGAREPEREEQRRLSAETILRARRRVREFGDDGAPSWVTESLGERPPDPERGRAWDQAVEGALRYRWRWGIADDEPGLLGPQPADRERVAEWRRAIEGMERDRRRLERTDRSRSLGLSLGRSLGR